MPFARFTPILGILVLTGTLSACDKECGDTVYATQGDAGADGKLLPQTGWVRTYKDTDFSTMPLDAKAHGVTIVKEVSHGTGRFAQATRFMTVRFQVRDALGQELGGGETEFLYPPVDPGGRAGGRIGRVPDSFANGLAGMRVGGERIFTAPADRDEYRAFMAHRTMRSVFQLPESGRLTYQVELLAVCRPEVCVRETYSVPAMTMRETYIKHCD